ncbi:MAG: hypothetical protein AAFY65_04150 [Pseudomonadota bacterium]
MGRVIMMAVTLGMLGAAGYASWFGLGTLSRDTGAAAVAAARTTGRVGATSVRSGSIGNRSSGTFRVK